MFTLTLVDSNEKESLLFYDNKTNQFFNIDGTLLVEHEKQPQELQPYVIRVYTGKGCNIRCEYCLQQDYRKPVKNKMSITELVKQIMRVVDDNPVERIHLWGGEPLLYFNECKEYVNEFNKYKSMKFMTSTNGILLKDLNIQKWLFENIHRLQISWDGPGQYLRGEDPLKDKSILSFIDKMLSKDNHSIIFSPVMTKANRCLVTYSNLIKQIIGRDDFIMGPARLLLPLDDKMTEHAITEFSELDDYAFNLRNNIILGNLPQWNFLQYYVGDIYGSIGSEIGPGYCPSQHDYFMMIDQNGELLTCANIDSDATDEYGTPASMGNITQLEKGARPVMKFKQLDERYEERCSKCIIYSVCQGGCPRVPKHLVESYCNSKLAELLPVYIATLHAMTGGKILTKVSL